MFTDGVLGGIVKSPLLRSSQETQRIIPLDVLKSFLNITSSVFYCADLPMAFHDGGFHENCFCCDAMQTPLQLAHYNVAQ